VGKPEGKTPLGRPRRRWEDRIRMDLREIGWGRVEWIHLAQDRDRWRAILNTVMNPRVLAPRSWCRFSVTFNVTLLTIHLTCYNNIAASLYVSSTVVHQLTNTPLTTHLHTNILVKGTGKFHRRKVLKRFI
jgi:hypothetical protein